MTREEAYERLNRVFREVFDDEEIILRIGIPLNISTWS